MDSTTTTRWTLPLVILLTASAAVNALNHSSRDSSYSKFATGSYKYFATTLTWPDAANRCEEDNAYLTIPNSAEEVKVYRKLKPAAMFWIGVHDFYCENRFETVLGDLFEDVGYVYWHKSQPEGKRDENCVLDYNGHLHDYSCDRQFAFICER